MAQMLYGVRLNLFLYEQLADWLQVLGQANDLLAESGEVVLSSI
jgi:hypothetical protein